MLKYITIENKYYILIYFKSNLILWCKAEFSAAIISIFSVT